jgi:hypothetical protein
LLLSDYSRRAPKARDSRGRKSRSAQAEQFLHYLRDCQVVRIVKAGSTARPDLDLEQQHRFAEGLLRRLTPHLDGYAALRQAAAQQGFFEQVLAESA